MNKSVSKFAHLLTLFLIFLASFYRSGKIVESDVFWQTRAGLDFLNHQTLLTNDIWSYAPHAGEWIPNSWGWNAILGYAYKYSATFGLFTLGFVVSIIFFSIIISASRKIGSSWNSINHTLSVIIIFSLPILSLRPALISALAVAIVLFFIEDLLRLFTKRPIILTILFLLLNFVMINLHLSWPAYLFAGLVGVTGYLLTTSSYKKTLFTMLPLTIAAVIGITANPLEFKWLSHVLFTISSSTDLIYEWRPIWEEPIYILGLIIILVQLYPVTKFKRIRPWAFTSVAFGIMGIMAIRFLPWAFLFALPAWSFWIRSFRIKKDKYLSLPGVALAVALTTICFEASELHGMPAYLDAIKVLPPNCHLIATPLPSGAVILFRPDVKIFVDGRNDYWGKERYQIVSDFSKKPDADLLAIIKPTCALTEKNSPMSTFFRYSRSWDQVKSPSNSMEVWSLAASPQ